MKTGKPPVPPSPGTTPDTDPEMALAATKTVAQHARTTQEAREFLMMLGLLETPDRPVVHDLAPCVGTCGRQLRKAGTPPLPDIETVVYSARGMCGTCARRSPATGNE